jgi:hypothetical protein
MKVLKGSLKESLYGHPSESMISKGILSPMKVEKETILAKEDVSYISSEDPCRNQLQATDINRLDWASQHKKRR